MDCQKIDLILASGSPRRKELLHSIGLEFEVIPADIDESQRSDMPPCDFVKYLASQKAEYVYRAHKGKWILAADTIVVYNDNILCKPSDKEEAIAMIEMLQGNTHYVVTGVAVISPDGRSIVDCEKTYVKFRPLSNNEVDLYVMQNESFDKSGAYAIQGKGALLIESIDGCYFNVVGLPLFKTSKIFEMLGVSFFDEWRSE